MVIDDDNETYNMQILASDYCFSLVVHNLIWRIEILLVSFEVLPKTGQSAAIANNTALFQHCDSRTAFVKSEELILKVLWGTNQVSRDWKRWRRTRLPPIFNPSIGYMIQVVRLFFQTAFPFPLDSSLYQSDNSRSNFPNYPKILPNCNNREDSWFRPGSKCRDPWSRSAINVLRGSSFAYFRRGKRRNEQIRRTYLRVCADTRHPNPRSHTQRALGAFSTDSSAHSPCSLDPSPFSPIRRSSWATNRIPIQRRSKGPWSSGRKIEFPKTRPLAFVFSSFS